METTLSAIPTNVAPNHSGVGQLLDLAILPVTMQKSITTIEAFIFTIALN